MPEASVHSNRRVYNPRATSTRCIVSFHSDDNFDGTIQDAHPLLGSIVGVSTSKSFGGASGSFSITIKKPRSLTTTWHRLFSNPEGTWVRITYLVDGQGIPVLWGMVDAIQESTVRSDTGTRTETYTVTGRDFGKVFEDSKTLISLFAVHNLDLVLGMYQAANIDPYVGTADGIVKKAINIWLGNGGLASKQYRLPKSLAEVSGAQSIYDTMNFSTIQKFDDGNGITEAMSIIDINKQSGGALWDLLQQYCNGVLNEMWVDLAPHPEHNGAMRPAFYLRERIFRTQGDTNRWDQTRVRQLEKNDVRSRNLAKGGAANRYNYWVITGSVLGDQFETQAQTHSMGLEPFKPGAIPIINVESVQRHGLRPYTANTNFLPFFKQGQGTNFIRLAANWLKRIHDWYGVAPFQLSGTIMTTRMFPEIRIGQRIQELRDEGSITYYVEGVDHNWSHPGPGSTTITVTHGEYDDGVSALAHLYAQYETPAANAAALDAIEEQSRLAQRNADLALIDEYQTIVPGENVNAESDDVIAALAKPADPTMMPGKDGPSSQATKVATGESQDPVADKEVETTQAAVSLPQDNLEAILPIAVAPGRTPKAPGTL
jgi:hypothetical protein